MENLVFSEAGFPELDQVLDIYNHYIAASTATFDYGPVSREEFSSRVLFDREKYGNRYGLYLIYFGNELAGFCFFTRFRVKKAYERTAELGVYFKPEFTGKGLGKEAVNFLEKEAAASGIKVLIASISGENSTSIRLAEKMGYQKCAHYQSVGEKFGRVLDVVEYQKILD